MWAPLKGIIRVSFKVIIRVPLRTLSYKGSFEGGGAGGVKSSCRRAPIRDSIVRVYVYVCARVHAHACIAAGALGLPMDLLHLYSCRDGSSSYL